MDIKNKNYVEAMAALEALDLDPVTADPWDVDPDVSKWAVWFGDHLEHVVGEDNDGTIGVALNDGETVEQFKTMADALAFIGGRIFNNMEA